LQRELVEKYLEITTITTLRLLKEFIPVDRREAPNK